MHFEFKLKMNRQRKIARECRNLDLRCRASPYAMSLVGLFLDLEVAQGRSLTFRDDRRCTSRGLFVADAMPRSVKQDGTDAPLVVVPRTGENRSKTSSRAMAGEDGTVLQRSILNLE